MASRVVVSSLLAGSCFAIATVQQSASETQSNANPIRKVVTLLQKMQAEVTAEGEKEAALYKKFMCYCSTNGNTLSESIDASSNKISSLDSQLASASAQKEQTEADLKKHQASRSDAKK